MNYGSMTRGSITLKSTRVNGGRNKAKSPSSSHVRSC